MTKFTDFVLMRYSKANTAIRRYGWTYRPYEGEAAWVHPDDVATRRDKGWEIVRKITWKDISKCSTMTTPSTSSQEKN